MAQRNLKRREERVQSGAAAYLARMVKWVEVRSGDEIWRGAISWVELRCGCFPCSGRDCAAACGIYLAPVRGSGGLRRGDFAGRICVWRLFADGSDSAIFAGDEGGGAVCARGRVGAGDLQRISDFAGSGVTAWRDDAQQGAAFSVPATAHTGGSDGYAVYWRCDAGPSARDTHCAYGRKLFLRTGDAGGIGAQQPDYFSLRAVGWR